MKNLFKIISGFAIVVLISITALAYICPMSLVGSMSMVSSPIMCDAVGAMSGSADGCVNSHLNAAAQLLGDVPQTINYLLALVLVAVVSQVFVYIFLTAFAAPIFNSFRYRYLHYRTSIKFLVESKILKYLSFLGNYTVVSFS